MHILSYKEFIDNIILEELHPELHEIVKSGEKSKGGKKQYRLAKKIKELKDRGENIGIEGNMPKGSSRAYLKHSDDHPIHVDGEKTKIKTGIKVAITSDLDKHHDHDTYGMPLGNMQNHAENGDYWVNNTYRTLVEDSEKDGHYHTNEEYGIFPPLIEHDHDNHEYSHIGHVDGITHKKFSKLTKTEEFPNGISHTDFVDSLMRNHLKNMGRYWGGNSRRESELDKIDEHPLVEKFRDYHNNSANTPADYSQIQNMGVWTHPINGTKHIVARDHGFNNEVASAYSDARMVQAAGERQF